MAAKNTEIGISDAVMHFQYQTEMNNKEL